MPTAIYDAIIVGSGITGGWAAKELTEKGLNTLVLEAGRTIVPERDYVEHVPVWELRHRDWDDRFVRERTQPIQRECYYACDEKLVRVFVAGIIALALNRLGALANETIVPVAVPELPDRDVLDVITFGNDGTPRLENQRVEAFFGELFRGPAAGDSGANNDRERE